LGEKTGYDFVIDRPYNLSKDNTPSNFAIKHATNFLEKKIKFTHVCCVYPMAILFKKKHLISAVKILKKKMKLFFQQLNIHTQYKEFLRLKKISLLNIIFQKKIF
jgi:CMP-N-acetylneuraminic acid synthetase